MSPVAGARREKVAIITGASQGIGAGLVTASVEPDTPSSATLASIGPSDDPDFLTVQGDIADAETARARRGRRRSTGSDGSTP